MPWVVAPQGAGPRLLLCGSKSSQCQAELQATPASKVPLEALYLLNGTVPSDPADSVGLWSLPSPLQSPQSSVVILSHTCADAHGTQLAQASE